MKLRLRMGWAVAWREWRELIRSPQFFVVLCLVLILSPLSLLVGTRDYQARLEEHQTLREEKQELLEDPRYRETFGFNTPFRQRELETLRVLRPPRPLSVLCRGLDAHLPKYWDFSVAGISPGPAPFTVDRLADTFHHFDFDYLVFTGFGLLAVLLGYGSVVGESRAGTLRSALSHPLPRWLFLLGKLAGGTGVLVISLLLSLAVVVSVGVMWELPLMQPQALARLPWLAAVWMLYLLCVYAGALMISSLAGLRRTALLASLVGWLVLVFVMPSAATLIARSLSPAASPHSVLLRVEKMQKELADRMEPELGRIYRQVTGLGEGVVRSSAEEPVEEELRAAFTPVAEDYLRQRGALAQDVYGEYQRRLQRQRRIADGLLWFSPAALASKLSADLAGTGDTTLASAYEAQVEAHQARLREALFDDPPLVPFRNTTASAHLRFRQAPPYADLPRFQAPPSNPSIASGTLLTLISVLAYWVAFMTAAFYSFSRRDVS